jgi:hypothetical protein
MYAFLLYDFITPLTENAKVPGGVASPPNIIAIQ